jgi:hypothetical protein
MSYSGTVKGLFAALAIMLVGVIVIALLFGGGGQNNGTASMQWHSATGDAIKSGPDHKDSTNEAPAFRVIRQGHGHHSHANGSR